MKILIFSEGVTLAHFMRPIVIAKDLQKKGYQVVVAVTQLNKNLSHLTDGLKIIQLNEYITSKMFLKSIAKGEHPFTQPILEKQVAEDIELIKHFQPNLVIGDMRLSLHISCQLTKSIYINLSNSQWDINSVQANVIPDLPIVKFLGVRIGLFVMKYIKPILFWKLAIPFNKTAKQFGVNTYGNYLSVLSSGDYTFYLDLNGLAKQSSKNNSLSHTPLAFPQKKKIEVGALDYSIKEMKFSSNHTTQNDPEIVTNNKLRKGKKKIFISLGSSGPSHLLSSIIRPLQKMNVEICIATSGRPCNIKSTDQIHIFEYISYEKIVPECDLVICNGGSASIYPILSHGTPILAIPMNFDQHLFTEAILQFNVGLSIRSDDFKEKYFIRDVTTILENKFFQCNAQYIAKKMHAENPLEVISTYLKWILTHSNRQKSHLPPVENCDLIA